MNGVYLEEVVVVEEGSVVLQLALLRLLHLVLPLLLQLSHTLEEHHTPNMNACTQATRGAQVISEHPHKDPTHKRIHLHLKIT